MDEYWYLFYHDKILVKRLVNLYSAMLKVVSNARGDAETGEWSVQEREISFNVCPTYVTNIECLPD